MTAIEIFDLLRDRFQFAQVRDLLKRSDFSVSQGWENSRVKIEEQLVEFDDDDAEETFSEILRNLILYGEKTIRLYPIAKKEMQQLRSVFSKMQPTAGAAASAYPGVVDSAALSALPLRPSICALEDDELPSIVLTGRTYLTSRDEFEVDELDDDVRAEFLEYDRLIAVRRTPVQYFDVVALHPTQNLLEIRLGTEGIGSKSDIERRIKAAKSKINSVVETKTGISGILANFKNVFPAISALYGESSGSVKRLGGVTSTASVKDEKMRSRKDDLRTEAFHKTGTSAVPAFSKFSICKCWESETGIGHIELEIPGAISTASQQNPVLKTIRIKALDREEFYFALNKVL